MKRKELYVKDKKAINKAICGAAPGFYTDEYWNGKNLVTEALEKACIEMGLTWEITYSAYGVWDNLNEPTRKQWGFKVVDEANNRESYGIIVAAGAGTVKDPMSRYDICAYIS